MLNGLFPSISKAKTLYILPVYQLSDQKRTKWKSHTIVLIPFSPAWSIRSKTNLFIGCSEVHWGVGLSTSCDSATEMSSFPAACCSASVISAPSSSSSTSNEVCRVGPSMARPSPRSLHLRKAWKSASVGSRTNLIHLKRPEASFPSKSARALTR